MSIARQPEHSLFRFRPNRSTDLLERLYNHNYRIVSRRDIQNLRSKPCCQKAIETSSSNQIYRNDFKNYQISRHNLKGLAFEFTENSTFHHQHVINSFLSTVRPMFPLGYLFPCGTQLFRCFKRNKILNKVQSVNIPKKLVSI